MSVKAFSFLLSLALACSSPAGEVRSAALPPAPAGRPLPALEDALASFETSTGAALPFAALLERLARVDVVFLGETHLDDTTHRVELAVLEGLRSLRAGKVVLSLEMFERDVQPVLDDYLAGRIDEETFLSRARPWGNYRTDYRPLIETAKRHQVPVVAANAPAALRRRVTSGGRAALETLAPEERRLMPAEVLPAEASYWERVDRATRGHMGFATLPDDKRLYSGQNLWDNCMGEACARALAANAGCTVVHVVGGFHVMYRDGTAAQLRARAPDAKLAVVEVIPASGPYAARPERDAERADYLVYATELARSVSDGAYAVSLPSELRYTLDLPSWATEQRPARLLLWLPDGDERPEDARALLRSALGEEVALAVLEPPYPQPSADLAPGGCWSRSAAFREDQARVQHSLERIVEYVTRRLPVSGERVVVAGRGLGATAALWSALYTEWLDARFVALAPRGERALQLEGLPDRAPVTRSVLIAVEARALEASRWLADDYRTVGVEAELRALAADASPGAELEVALRSAFGLERRAVRGAEAELVVLERDLPRARQWGEVYAERLRTGERAARVVLAAELKGDEDPARVHRLALGDEWPLASFAEGKGIPLAPGDFGGTTLLVVPAGTEPSTREAWLALERDKVLKKRSPFANLRVALADGEPGLAQVTGELAASGAHSVLVVPAVFCASPAEMQALASTLRVSDAADALDLTFLPGLGAELVGGGEEE